MYFLFSNSRSSRFQNWPFFLVQPLGKQPLAILTIFCFKSFDLLTSSSSFIIYFVKNWRNCPHLLYSFCIYFFVFILYSVSFEGNYLHRGSRNHIVYISFNSNIKYKQNKNKNGRGVHLCTLRALSAEFVQIACTYFLFFSLFFQNGHAYGVSTMGRGRRPAGKTVLAVANYCMKLIVIWLDL